MCSKRLETSSQSGFVIPLVAILLVIIGAFVALGFDIGRVWLEQRQIHMASDMGAFAGAAVLRDAAEDNALGSLDPNDVRDIAIAIAEKNGLSNSSEVEEIVIGQLQDPPSGQDFPYINPNVPQTDWDAVGVRSRRTVTMAFAQLVGTGEMNPSVFSVAMIDENVPPLCAKPFGIEESATAGLGGLDDLPSPYLVPLMTHDGCEGRHSTYNYCITVSDESPGNWGKLNVLGEDGEPSNTSGNDFCDYMIGSPCPGGADGADPQCGSVPTGEQDPDHPLYLKTATGAGFLDVFACLVGQEISILIIDEFPTGKKVYNIRRHARIEVLDARKDDQSQICAQPSSSGGGTNWEVDFNLLEISVEPIEDPDAPIEISRELFY